MVGYQILMISLIFRTLPPLSKKWSDGNLLVQLVRRKERLLLKKGRRSLHFSALLAIPHLVSQDDVYRGYSIPKDTIVIANSWLVLTVDLRLLLKLTWSNAAGQCYMTKKPTPSHLSSSPNDF